jgi:lysophospholipase L1-like esterase
METQPTSRRSFLRQASLAALSLPVIAPIIQAANRHVSPGRELKEKSVILFQGDSITDAWRHKDRYYANDSLGMGIGYVHYAATNLLGRHPGKHLKFYNRGVSGHKVFQLAGRWEEDCLQLGPDVLSILIGVNDYWHTLDFGYSGTANSYEDDLRKLLDRTKKALPNVRLIMGEPFYVKGGTAIKERWHGEFPAYQAAARQIAEDYQAVFIPYQAVFNKALETAPVEYWCPDGVHPSLAGNYLMAHAWMESFEKM